MKKHPTGKTSLILQRSTCHVTAWKCCGRRENLPLVSGERVRNGEYMLILRRIGSCPSRCCFSAWVACSLECSTTSMLNRTVSCVTALRVSTLATSWTRGSRSLELEMDGWTSSCVWNLGGVAASGDIRLSVFGRETRLSVPLRGLATLVVVERPSTCQDSHLTWKPGASQGSLLRVAQEVSLGMGRDPRTVHTDAVSSSPFART